MQMRSLKDVYEVLDRVRNGGCGAGGIKYDDAARLLGDHEGDMTYVEMAKRLGVTVADARDLARDLMLSRHGMSLTTGLEGCADLDYEEEE